MKIDTRPASKAGFCLYSDKRKGFRAQRKPFQKENYKALWLESHRIEVNRAFLGNLEAEIADAIDVDGPKKRVIEFNRALHPVGAFDFFKSA